MSGPRLPEDRKGERQTGNFPSLQKICMHTLFSTEYKPVKGSKKLELPRQLQDKYIKFKQEKLKSLLKAILSGEEPRNVKEMIEEYPILLLEELNEKECATIQGPAGHKPSLTAYRTALATEDTQMAAMIKAQLIKIADEKEADKQFNAQFPKGYKYEFCLMSDKDHARPQNWEEEEKAKWAGSFNQLKTLTQAIRYAAPGDIISSGDPEYKLTVRKGSAVAVALDQFRALLDTTLNEIAITGRHFNPNLLLQAFQIYDEHYKDYFGNNWSNPRAMLFWQQVIGKIQRVMPANYVQAFCDGLLTTREKLQKGEAQSRACVFRVYRPDMGWGATSFYPLVDSRLGFDYAIYSPRGGAAGGARLPFGAASCCADRLLKLMSIKNSMCAELTQHQNRRDDTSRSACVVR